MVLMRLFTLITTIEGWRSVVARPHKHEENGEHQSQPRHSCQHLLHSFADVCSLCAPLITLLWVTLCVDDVVVE